MRPSLLEVSDGRFDRIVVKDFEIYIYIYISIHMRNNFSTLVKRTHGSFYFRARYRALRQIANFIDNKDLVIR